MPLFDEMTGQGAPEWPYPVKYGKENELSADVLVIGGGIAGCHAAINAAKRGAKVIVLEKGATVHSGCSGAGVDHWGAAYTNPACTTNLEQAAESSARRRSYVNGMLSYITMRESFDALLDCEQWGMKFRDEDDEFAGSPMRDEKSKILFAYDYTTRVNIRVNNGAHVKPILYKELLRLGVKVLDRVMMTGLLTEGGKPGGRVIGAMGVNVRTGEFYTVSAKATIVSAAQYSGIWVFNTELTGSAIHLDDPNNVGEATAAAWRAGAELSLMERSKGPVHGSFGWPRFGVGSPTNTWFPCNLVDANGKPVPWVDREGNILETVAQRTAFKAGASPTPDINDMIARGELVLPLFADLPSMPEDERRAIWGLMIANEGKTRVPVYQVFGEAGFDPDKDMLQAPITTHEIGGEGEGPPLWRSASAGGGWGSGGLVVDWDLKTNLPGLYAAGNAVAGENGGHPGAATTGRYSGRKAAEYAATVDSLVPDRKQIDAEKARVYQRIGQPGDVGWKELNAGTARIMQIYCGAYKSERMLKEGMWWLDSIRESEANRTYVRNPHELMRYLECQSRLTISEVIINASLARQASSQILDFHRVDYPEVEPKEWNKFITLKLQKDSVVTESLPLNYYLTEPYLSTFKENYEAHASLNEMRTK
ncbi:MAG: FAD-dependent oxidoreductase [Chloroflexi bacterium]|nr:FAD-dependent oxidoreductase [Chloroflexota bacterium]